MQIFFFKPSNHEQKRKYEWMTFFLWKEIWSIWISVNQSFTRNFNLSFSCFRLKWLDWSIDIFLKQRIYFKFYILRGYFRKIFVRDLEQSLIFSSPEILRGFRFCMELGIYDSKILPNNNSKNFLKYQMLLLLTQRDIQPFIQEY